MENFKKDIQAEKVLGEWQTGSGRIPVTNTYVTHAARLDVKRKYIESWPRWPGNARSEL